MNETFELNPRHVQAAFSGGELRYGDSSVRLETVEIGQVVITSGAVIASDPFFGDSAPLKRRLQPGTYPVSLAVVHFAHGDTRTAFARMVLRDSPVIHWEPAWIEATPWSQSERLSYFAEVGYGCFMDALILGWYKQRRVMLVEEDPLQDQLGRNHSWAEFQPDPHRPENLICFCTGWGPGAYASYFGITADEEPSVLITDFLVLRSAG